MKKMVAKNASTSKKVVRKTVHRVSRRSSSTTVVGMPILFRRILIFTPLTALFFAIVTMFSGQPLTQAVAGASVFKGMFAQATVEIPSVSGAVSYNIYYKQTSDAKFINAVRHISPSVHSYLISYLKKGVSYQYRISAINSSGAEFSWTSILPLTNIQPM